MESEQITKERADFHIHYTDETARGIIDKALEMGVRVVALVRRSEISDRLPEFIAYGREKGVTVLPGTEQLVRVENGLVEAICLDFDFAHPEIRRFFGKKEAEEKNASVAARQKQFLELKGFTFNDLAPKDRNKLEELLAGKILEKAKTFCQIVNNTEANQSLIQKLLKENNEVYREAKETNWRFLWKMFFAPGKEGYIPVQPQAKELINAVHSAHGVVLYSPEGKFKRENWDELKDFGIDGIMIWHGGRAELPASLIKEIREQGFLILGGSDYDPEKDDWKTGVGQGAMFISSPRRYEEIKSYKKRKGL